MKSTYLTPLVAVLIAAPALAQSTRTTTVDRPNYDTTRTVTRDPAAGSVTRDTDVTRKSDGATASRDVARTRADGSITASGSTTNFAGQTRSFDYARTRTDGGATASGSVTRHNGDTLTYQANQTHGGGSYTSQRSVTGAEGQTLYSRDVSATRTGTGVSRSVDTSRAAGFHPRAMARGLRRGR